MIAEAWRELAGDAIEFTMRLPPNWFGGPYAGKDQYGRAARSGVGSRQGSVFGADMECTPRTGQDQAADRTPWRA